MAWPYDYARWYTHARTHCPCAGGAMCDRVLYYPMRVCEMGTPEHIIPTRVVWHTRAGWADVKAPAVYV